MEEEEEEEEEEDLSPLQLRMSWPFLSSSTTLLPRLPSQVADLEVKRGGGGKSREDKEGEEWVKTMKNTIKLLKLAKT